MTKEQINPRFLFVLEMYGAADRYLENRKEYTKNDSEGFKNASIKMLNDEKNFNGFISGSFCWKFTPEKGDYWFAIAIQNEPEIFKFNEAIK